MSVLSPSDIVFSDLSFEFAIDNFFFLEKLVDLSNVIILLEEGEEFFKVRDDTDDIFIFSMLAILT
jgi:hypothetical protein